MVLGIYGCGGLGKEFLILANEINERKRWTEIIFIVDNVIKDTVKNTRVISVDDAINQYGCEGLEVVIAIGEPFIREEKYLLLKERGINLATLIHPSVKVPDCTALKQGVVICFGSFISCDVIIGHNAVIMPHANIGHDCTVGNSSMICSFASFGGSITVGETVFIGMSACIMQGTSIGKGAIVSMGSCVMRDVPEETVVMGNPARVMAKNDTHHVFNR